ncbi:MAG: hypothetical protein QM529_03370 [Hydrotalea sp.]|nr:hypothetical protein [Hydrotalea sp.]
MKKNPSASAVPSTSPLILLPVGDYWHPDFPGLTGLAGADSPDRGRIDNALTESYVDKSRPDGFIINHGLLLTGVAPLAHHALQTLVAPVGEAHPEKFLINLLGKLGAAKNLSPIRQDIYYQSSLAVKKSGLLVMRCSESSAMVYNEQHKPSPRDNKSPSPFIQPSGAGWQLVRVSGQKKLNDFLSSFIPLPKDNKSGDNFYCLSILNKPLYIFYQGDEALFFIPRSAAASLFCHLALVAAVKTNNLTRIKIDY